MAWHSMSSSPVIWSNCFPWLGAWSTCIAETQRQVWREWSEGSSSWAKVRRGQQAKVLATAIFKYYDKSETHNIVIISVWSRHQMMLSLYPEPFMLTLFRRLWYARMVCCWLRGFCRWLRRIFRGQGGSGAGLLSSGK